MFTRLFWLPCLLVPLAVAEGPRVITADQMAVEYKGFRLMTATPALVPMEAAVACMGITEMSRRSERYGPGAKAAVQIYMNNPAAGAYAAGGTSYPLDAVVVKVKTETEAPAQAVSGKLELQSFTANSPQTLAPAASGPAHKFHGLGGMIKRAPGYDSTHGDWEYFYVAPGGEVESGRIATCVVCHQAATGRDCVFGGWETGFAGK